MSVSDYFGRCIQYRVRRFGFVQPEVKNSDVIIGSIRIPFAFYFPIQRGFSGSIQTLPLARDYVAAAVRHLPMPSPTPLHHSVFPEHKQTGNE